MAVFDVGGSLERCLSSIHVVHRSIESKTALETRLMVWSLLREMTEMQHGDSMARAFTSGFT